MNKRTGEDRIWTIPNILSIFRMVLIPVFVWTYCGLKNDLATALVLLLSGISDTADGIIARRFNMITTLGKAIDPVADKLTQIAMLLCLLTRFPSLITLFALLLIKEITGGVMSLQACAACRVALQAHNFPALRHHASAPPLGFDTGIGLEREHRGVLSGDADVVCALFYTEFPRAVPFGGQVRRGLR